MSKEVAVIAGSNLSLSLGFNPFEQSLSKEGFESQDVEFFNPEGLEGVEMAVYMREITLMEIKGETKEFVKAYVQMADGEKLYYFGQHQILTTYRRNEKGKGVLAFVTFEGKRKMKDSAKTLNHFKILAKSL